jgi:DNA-binding NarL/FixJ family response regulator
LFISARTVETHRAHILTKLKLHSLADAVRFAARNGLLVEIEPVPGLPPA